MFGAAPKVLVDWMLQLAWPIPSQRGGVRFITRNPDDVREDVNTLCAALNAKGYRQARPGVQAQPWGSRDMAVSDPFGNRLVFWSEG
ncbi:glyoxalase superfamily protein [Pararhodobacter sp.]|uniref:glyoxalase superfamily protein n=1 Tax=Pararhodobacter sp. TaxID=2127056 RepID=UPI002FE3B997